MENPPFSCVLGVDFIKSSRMIINIAQGTYHFANKSQHNFQFTNQETLMALQGLTPTQEDDVARLIKKFNTISTETLGCTNWFSCELKVEGPPIAQKPYKVSPFKSEVIKKHVNRMLQMGAIRPSDSEWASPVTLSKEGDEFRFCLDYRQLNKRCKSDPYPVPRIDSLLHRLGDACFISKIDLRKAYWQIPMHENSIKYTAFICDEGKFEWVRLPFGLKVAPSLFQRCINTVLKDARGRFAEAYLDDIIVFSSNWEEHLEHLEYIFDRLRQVGFTINTEKCSFGKTTVNYLGFIITPEWIKTDPEKTAAVRNWPISKSPKKVKRFLGLCGWYRHYIPNFSSIAEPLNRLLKKNIPFTWSESQQSSLDKLKNEICDSVVLAYPDFTRPFILRTDSSDFAVGAVLAQKELDGHERPIAFASRSLSQTERNYHATEKECLAIVWALKKFEHYLDGQQFSLETENRALTWLNSMRDVNSKFMRWALKIQDFSATISHCPGRLNVVADNLSRINIGEAEEEETKEVMFPPIYLSSILLPLTLTSDLTLEKLAAEQSTDSEVQDLISQSHPDYVVDDKILYELTHTGMRLPFIPHSLRSSILQYYHDLPHAGHMGIRKTLGRILRRVFWKGIQSDVYSYVQSCPVCQAVKNPQAKPSGNLQSNKVFGPWDLLAIDLVGPLPKTKYGKTQLLVVVDHFTKWVELFAMRDAKAPTICKILESEIFCLSLLSDNATYFRGSF
jgi:hypothetical protein